MRSWTHLLVIGLFCLGSDLAESQPLEGVATFPTSMKKIRQSPGEKRWISPEKRFVFRVIPRSQTAKLMVYDLTSHRPDKPLGSVSLPSEWAEADISMGPLSKESDSGYVLWIKPGNQLTMVFFDSVWKNLGQDTYYDSEFSTTGWSTVSASYTDDGRFGVRELHESPGGETEDGPVVDTWVDWYCWDSKIHSLVNEPRP